MRRCIRAQDATGNKKKQNKHKNTRVRERALPPRRPPVLGGRRPSRPPPHDFANSLDSRFAEEGVEADEDMTKESQRRAVSLGSVDVGVVEFQVRR